MKKNRTVLVDMIMGRISYFAAKESYEWKGYCIDSQEGAISFLIRTETKSVEICIASDGSVFVYLYEISHREIGIYLGSCCETGDANERSAEAIMADIRTLTGVFWSDDFHAYMYIVELFVPREESMMSYQGEKDWHLMHQMYKEMYCD